MLFLGKRPVRRTSGMRPVARTFLASGQNSNTHCTGLVGDDFDRSLEIPHGLFIVAGGERISRPRFPYNESTSPLKFLIGLLPGDETLFETFIGAVVGYNRGRVSLP